MEKPIDHIAKSVNELFDASTERPNFNYNGLATRPAKAIRSFFGFFGKLDVPPGTWGVCFAPETPPVVLKPGQHWLSGLSASSTLVQFVDAIQRRKRLEAVTGISLDGWTITLVAEILFKVTDPLKITETAEPIPAVIAITRSAILAQIEEMTHDMLLGDIDTPGNNHHPKNERGLDHVARGILHRLESRPGLAGIQVIDLAIIERTGDENLIDILKNEALERMQAKKGQLTETARAELEKIRLEMQVQTAQAERAVSLIQAETQSQLSSIEEQLRIIKARTDAEVQEIQQVQEACEAERRRIAEEWRTAKELEQRSMEYQHEETIAVIQGTTQITTEAAKNGFFNTLQGNNQRFEFSQPGNPDAVSAGIQALRGFRDKISPPTTHFLPRPALLQAANENRVEAETFRLDRIQMVEHEMLIRHGEISKVTIWFTPQAPQELAGLTMVIECQPGYPVSPPEVHLERSLEGTSPADVTAEEDYPVENWTPQLYLADLVREVMFSVISNHEA